MEDKQIFDLSGKRHMQPVPNNVVIIGGGLAGLFTALKLAPLRVTVIAGGPLGTSEASALAQGGIAAAVGTSDTVEAHAADTILAGDGLVDEQMAHLLAAEAPARILDLLQYGVPFDKDTEGALKLSQEAAHSARRVVKVEGDMAGAVIMDALIKKAREAPHIRLLEDTWAQELVVSGHRVTGVSIQKKSESETQIVYGAAIVLATGGVGGLYALTTNPRGAIGSGIAMAAEVGAVISDAEFIQFHPTAIISDQDPAPLATEALRGEGAVLVNDAGERFMQPLHEAAELAPRDIVARAVFAENSSGRRAYLDCRKAIGAQFEHEFPRVYGLCREAGIDPVHELIPVAPAAHYHMGGVLTDANGRTTIDGLWACGEVAATGVHGANRLASNSLLEAVVFGARIASDLKLIIPASVIYTEKILPAPATPLTQSADGGIMELRRVMSAHMGVVRDKAGLVRALEVLSRLQSQPSSPWLAAMCTTALLITSAAWKRLESRGGHFRSDYPQKDTASRRSLMTLEKAHKIARKALKGKSKT